MTTLTKRELDQVLSLLHELYRIHSHTAKYDRSEAERNVARAKALHVETLAIAIQVKSKELI